LDSLPAAVRTEVRFTGGPPEMKSLGLLFTEGAGGAEMKQKKKSAHGPARFGHPPEGYSFFTNRQTSVCQPPSTGWCWDTWHSKIVRFSWGSCFYSNINDLRLPPKPAATPADGRWNRSFIGSSSWLRGQNRCDLLSGRSGRRRLLRKQDLRGEDADAGFQPDGPS